MLIGSFSYSLLTVEVPKPPFNTCKIVRFIAEHIRRVRIIPDAPTKAPAIIKMILFTITPADIAAIPDREFDAKLKFVAPKGTEQGGAVQFKIEADVTLDEDSFVRAGYSANGSLVVDNRQDIMVIAEALIQLDRRTQQPFVEIEISNQNFERKDIEIGLSDGIKVEIISGIEMTDKIKIWNKTEPIKIEPEESAFDQFRED